MEKEWPSSPCHVASRQFNTRVTQLPLSCSAAGSDSAASGLSDRPGNDRQGQVCSGGQPFSREDCLRRGRGRLPNRVHAKPSCQVTRELEMTKFSVRAFIYGRNSHVSLMGRCSGSWVPRCFGEVMSSLRFPLIN